MTKAEIFRAIEKRAVPGNVFSRYLRCGNLLDALAAKKFDSEYELLKFMGFAK